jgi:general secretion pathway protein D
MRRLHKQVMIDVKILSVKLDNSKSTGVDWSQLYKFQNVTAQYENLRSHGVAKIEDNVITEWGTQRKDYGNYIRLSGSVSIQNVLNFLNTQGDVSSMSNPKITTMNNQPAIFSSGEQLYYKIIQSVSQVSTGGSATGQNEVVRSVFAGVLLDITPEITDENEIILKINPSISSINGQVQTQNGVRVIPPDLKKQQMSAVVKLKDGERIVLGGLISSAKGKTVKKVPILGNLPVLGNAFKQDITTDMKEELVIIITPHIVSPYKKVSLKTLGYDGVY